MQKPRTKIIHYTRHWHVEVLIILENSRNYVLSLSVCVGYSLYVGTSLCLIGMIFCASMQVVRRLYTCIDYGFVTFVVAGFYVHMGGYTETYRR